MISGCITPLVTKAIENNYKTVTPDGSYTISSVFERRVQNDTSILVCFSGKLAYTPVESNYSIEIPLKQGEFADSVVKLDRSAVKKSCAPPDGYNEVSITKKYPSSDENVWYTNTTKFTTETNSLGCRTFESNSLGCHGSPTKKITFVFIEKEKYRGLNFDPTYALYAPAVVADILLTPVYLVVTMVALGSIVQANREN